MNRQGVIPTPLGFAGEWHDSATGLQYLRARWYQPATGRFTQVDPFPGVLSLPATQHPYQYALNNPLRYTDPSGEFVLPAGLALVVAAGFLAGVLYDAAQQYQEHGWACYNPLQGLLAGLTGAAIAGTTALTVVWLLSFGGMGIQGLGLLFGHVGLFKIGTNVLMMAALVSNWLWVGTPIIDSHGIRQWGIGRVKPVAEPLPPGWNEKWEQMYGVRGNTPHWFDEAGGEWRWHAPDRWHTVSHWDYNPWTEWNSKWKNIYPGK